MSMKRGLFYTFLTQAPTLLMYFVASTLMTRMLGEVGRGEYALITNFGALLALVMGMNIGVGITYFISRTPDHPASAIGTATTLLLLNIVAVPLLLWLLSLSGILSNVLMPDGREHWAYWGYVYMTVVLSLVNSAVAAVLLGTKRFAALNWMSMLSAGLSALGMLVLFLLPDERGNDEVFPLVLQVTAIASTLVTLVWCVIYAVNVRIPPVPVWSWRVMRPMITFSAVGHLSNLVNLINYRFDVWVVDQYKGAAELGLYAVAVGLGQLLFNVPEPFSRVVQPYLFGQQRNEMLSRFKAVARLNATVLTVLAIGLGLFAPWIIPLLFGSEFAPSILPLQLLLPGIVFSGMAKLLAQLVIQGGLQRFNLMATTVAVIVTITLDLALIPRWGMQGAAVASTLSYAVGLAILLGAIRQRMGISINDLFLLRPSDITSLLRQAPWAATR
ncbi:MAG: oligosaccharide flippase family protein [Flavobacteriales bacterium]|nr:oligosaccharide flippase family protein [Flavobacteriales bacterium]